MPDERIRDDAPERPDQARPSRSADDEFDDRPRPRRREREDDDETADATGGIIPYKNGMALAAYYCGVFGLIPCLGMLLGPIALLLGIFGFRYGQRHPKAGGLAHAVVGIVLGGIVVAGHVALIIAIAIGMI